jgi:hypothetical protein
MLAHSKWGIGLDSDTPESWFPQMTTTTSENIHQHKKPRSWNIQESQHTDDPHTSSGVVLSPLSTSNSRQPIRCTRIVLPYSPTVVSHPKIPNMVATWLPMLVSRSSDGCSSCLACCIACCVDFPCLRSSLNRRVRSRCIWLGWLFWSWRRRCVEPTIRVVTEGRFMDPVTVFLRRSVSHRVK